MNLGAALLGLFTIFVVKMAVMGWAARLLFRLYGTVVTRPPRRPWLLVPPSSLPHIRLLWWALVLFAVSELTCGVEIFILFRSSALLGMVHSVTSASAMGLFVLALWRWSDGELFGFMGRECIGRRICARCTVAEGECRYGPLLRLAVTFVGLAAIPPLLASTETVRAEPQRYLLPFPAVDAWYTHALLPWLQRNFPGDDPSGAAYALPSAVQVLDYRVIPAVVIVLSMVAVAYLRRGREDVGLAVAAFATGALSYSYFGLVLYRAMGDALLGSLGHEVGEFWFLVATAEFLARTFERSEVAA